MPSHQQLYAANPSPTRAAVDQKGRYVRGVTVVIQVVDYSSRSYGTDRPMPSSTSNLMMLVQIPTGLSQCKLSWIGGVDE